MNEKKPYDPLADSLNIESEIDLYTGDEKLPVEVPEDRVMDLVDADYDFTRRSVTGAIQKAEDALSLIMGVAQASQAPRAYEVVATLIKVILDGNKDLLELSKKTMDMKNAAGIDETPTTINNNLIVTTEQLQKMLKGQGVVTTTRDKSENNE